MRTHGTFIGVGGGMIERLAHFVVRRRRLVLAIFVVGVILAAGIGSAVMPLCVKPYGEIHFTLPGHHYTAGAGGVHASARIPSSP